MSCYLPGMTAPHSAPENPQYQYQYLTRARALSKGAVHSSAFSSHSPIVVVVVVVVNLVALSGVDQVKNLGCLHIHAHL